MSSEEPASNHRGIIPKASGDKSKPKVRGADGKFNTLDRLLVFQKVNRVWRPHLSSGERDLLFYLVDRTVSWGTDCVRTTVGQMVEGNAWAPSLGMSRASIFRAMKMLRERGILSSAFDGRQSVLTLNLNWDPVATSLPKPKRLKRQDASNNLAALFLAPEKNEIYQHLNAKNEGVSNCDSSSLKLRHQQSQIETLYNSTPTTVEDNDKNSRNTLSGVDGASQGSLPGMNDRVRNCPTAAQAIAAVKAKPRDKVARPLWVTWRNAWQAAFPNVPCTAWSKKDNGMIHRVEERAKQTKIDPVAFIEFCVLHWRETIVREFSWMKQSPPPTYPQVAFLAVDKFLEKFIDRYATSLTQKRLAFGLTDETTIERLRQTGMSYEDALIEIGKRKGVAEQRKEFEERGRELARQAAANERGQKALMQAPRAPAKPQPRLIHPTENDFDNADFEMPDFSDMKWEE